MRGQHLSVRHILNRTSSCYEAQPCNTDKCGFRKMFDLVPLGVPLGLEVAGLEVAGLEAAGLEVGGQVVAGQVMGVCLASEEGADHCKWICHYD